MATSSCALLVVGAGLEDRFDTEAISSETSAEVPEKRLVVFASLRFLSAFNPHLKSKAPILALRKAEHVKLPEFSGVYTISPARSVDSNRQHRHASASQGIPAGTDLKVRRATQRVQSDAIDQGSQWNSLCTC